MNPQQIAGLLNQTILFADLASTSLERLAGDAQVRAFKKGEFVFHAGDQGDWLYVIAEGALKVLVTSEDGEQMVLVTLRPPDVMGELSLIDGGPRSASVEVLEPSRAILISRRSFLGLMHDDQDFLERVLRHLGSLIRRLTEQTSDFVFLDLYGRVAKLLMGMAEERGERSGDEIVLELPLTQSDLAGMVGGSRQTVNQILRSFERKQYIDLEGKHLVIKRPDALRRRAGL